MPYYKFQYNGGKISIKLEDEELQVTRLKNQILMHFDKISFDSLSIFLLENGNTYSLDDNEIVDSEMEFVLEIDPDIV
tara:strand:+ start:518 stop:751 length:234 start_codon:yes stop_codon:yes gene_type:complete